MTLVGDTWFSGASMPVQCSSIDAGAPSATVTAGASAAAGSGVTVTPSAPVRVTGSAPGRVHDSPGFAVKTSEA